MFFIIIITQNDNSELAPALTEEEALEIMTKILDQLKSKATQLIRAAENIKQKLAQQGQELEDRKLMKAFVLPHFETGLQEIETGVLQAYDVDALDLQDAVETYVKEGNTKLKEICDRMRLIYREFGGEVDDLENEAADESAVPLTEDTLCAGLELISQRMSALTEQYIIEFKAENGIPRSESDLQEFQGGLMAVSEK